MNESRGIETYPVGLLSDIKRKRVRHGLGYLRQLIRLREWDSVRNYFNGYLAEWHYAPEGVAHTRAGRGWTRRAARRRLARHLLLSNLSPVEARR